MKPRAVWIDYSSEVPKLIRTPRAKRVGTGGGTTGTGRGMRSPSILTPEASPYRHFLDYELSES